MARYGLTTGDVAAALREQNAQFAAGRFGDEPNDASVPFTYSATTQGRLPDAERSEEHTSELQSLMRISYAVFCLKKKQLRQIYEPLNNKYILTYLLPKQTLHLLLTSQLVHSNH